MAKRRDHGEGSIFQRERDGKWVARLDYGYVDGKRKRVERIAATKTEARQKLNELKKDKEKGVSPEAHKMTLAYFMKDWLATVKANKSYNTHMMNDFIWRLHIEPKLGNVLLANLTPLKIQKFLTDATEAGKTKCQVYNCYRTLHVALNAALKLRLIAFNPASAVECPKYNPDERVMPDLEEIYRFIDVLEDEPNGLLFLTAIYTGMRRGELLALRWSDVDMDNGEINIRMSRTWQKGKGWVMGETKTRTSKRTIPIPPSLVLELRKTKAAQLRERLQTPEEEWKGGEMVFLGEKGGPVVGGFMNKQLTRILRENNLPHLRFHDLRHLHATLLLRDGCQAKQVQQAMGHSSVAITLGLYGHIMPDQHGETATRMERIMRKNGGIEQK
jgi:integrase